MKAHGAINKDQLEFLIEKIEESDIAHDYAEIEVTEDKTILLTGEIYSEHERRKLKELLMEHTDAEEIDDEDLIIIESGDVNPADIEDDDEYVSDEISPLKEDFAGTEDVYRSLEDGIPYIPPVENPEENAHISKNSWLKKKRKN